MRRTVRRRHGRNGSGPLRTPGVPPPRTANDDTPRHAPTSKRRSGWYAYVLGLRNEKVRDSNLLGPPDLDSMRS